MLIKINKPVMVVVVCFLLAAKAAVDAFLTDIVKEKKRKSKEKQKQKKQKQNIMIFCLCSCLVKKLKQKILYSQLWKFLLSKRKFLSFVLFFYSFLQR